MSPSQEVLNSIENRLRELEQEIAALQSARSKLQATNEPARGKRAPGRPGRPSRPGRPGRPGKTRSAPTARVIPTPPDMADEEWVARRAAELAAQSRAAPA